MQRGKFIKYKTSVFLLPPEYFHFSVIVHANEARGASLSGVVAAVPDGIIYSGDNSGVNLGEDSCCGLAAEVGRGGDKRGA